MTFDFGILHWIGG